MAALNFPNNPAAQTPVNTFSPTSTPDASDNGVTYIYNATNGAWTAESSSSSPGGGFAPTITTDTEPTTRVDGTPLQDGDLWWNSSTVVLYVYYVDTDNAQWVLSGNYLNSVTNDTAAGEITFEKITTHEEGIDVTGNVKITNGQLELPGGGGNTEALQKQEIESLISSSDTGAGKYVAVSGDTMTGQLSLPGGGGDTEALQKQEVKSLIDAIPLPPDPDLTVYVEKSGSNMTGDLTLGASNITLDATGGSITAASFIKSTDGGANPNQVVLTASGITSQRDTSDSGKYVWRGFGGDTQTSSITSDGSITAAGRCDIGSSSLDDNVGLKVMNSYDSAATLYVQQFDNAGDLISGRDGSNGESFRVGVDGSITAAANVISKNNNAYVELAPGANTSFRTFDESGNVNVTMGWDGSINAAGQIKSYSGSRESRLNPNGSLKLKTDETVSKVIDIESGLATEAFSVFPDGSITSAGSGTFGGNIQQGLAEVNDPGNLIYATGGYYSRFTDDADIAFQVNKDTSANVLITAGGSATFAGKVTSASTSSGDGGTTLATKDYVDTNSGSGDSVGTLQQVTDAGNTTTNGATFAGEVDIREAATNYVTIFPTGKIEARGGASNVLFLGRNGSLGSDIITFIDNGDATFKGQLDVNDVLSAAGGVRLNPTGTAFINPASTLPSSSVTFSIAKDRSVNSDTAISFLKSGAGTFADKVTSGSSTVRGQFLGNCPISITDSAADAFVANYDGTTVARVRYDGSITADGAIRAGDTVETSSSTFGVLDPSGQIYLQNNVGDDTKVVFGAYNGLYSTGSNRKILMYASGKAEFAGTIEAPRLNAGSLTHPNPAITATNGSAANGSLYARNNYGGTAPAIACAGGDGSVKAAINNDGSSTFAGNMALDFSEGTTGEVFRVKSGSDRNILFNGDGSASFAGRVDAGALTVDSNLTPASGTSIEHFYTTNGGIIQAYDRTNNNLEPLQVRGSTWALALDGSATFAGALEAESIDGGTY